VWSRRLGGCEKSDDAGRTGGFFLFFAGKTRRGIRRAVIIGNRNTYLLLPKA
jgi:hypothetical protein